MARSDPNPLISNSFWSEQHTPGFGVYMEERTEARARLCGTMAFRAFAARVGLGQKLGEGQ